MKRELISQALNMLDDRHISDTASFDPGAVQKSPERIAPMKRKSIISIALAAALILALGTAAYAAWSIHTARQQELKADLNIEESNVNSYVEYVIPDDQEGGLTLLSSVNDGEMQRVYVNVSPVSEEEAAGFADDRTFSWSFEGTDVGGFAGPSIPSGVTLYGDDEIREGILKYSYDKETQTLTLRCLIEDMFIERASAALGTDELPLMVHMSGGAEELRTFGPATFTPTEERTRYFDFGPAVYRDAELDRDIEIVGLELTPFAAVWKVSYEDAQLCHSPGADPSVCEPWSILEDRVCIETLLYFSDGSSFSTGGALTCPYKDGVVELHCSWGAAIDLDDIQKIVLNGLVLWENK